MIIFTRRSRIGFFLDTLLTVIGWVGFIYLFGTGIVAILQESAHGPQGPLWSAFLPTAGTITTYALIAAVNAAILIAWALYNNWRFSEFDRRRPIAPIDTPDIAQSFMLSASAVSGLNSTKISTLHHDAQGSIMSIQVGNSYSVP